MLVLALDTTTRAGSVALVEDERVVAEHPGDEARSHAERLPGELVALAAANGRSMPEIDLFAVASGPGSFTGLRIGIATIQGLAVVTRRRVVAIPALDALAHLGSRDAEPGAIVAAWMDAHRREVFAALFEVAAAPPFDPGHLVSVEPAAVDAPDAMLARWRSQLTGRAPVFIGDGAALYADQIVHAHSTARIIPPPPLAGAIGLLAVAHARSGAAIEPAAIRPVYVRRPDAVLDRERKISTTKDTKDTKEKSNRA